MAGWMVMTLGQCLEIHLEHLTAQGRQKLKGWKNRWLLASCLDLTNHQVKEVRTRLEGRLVSVLAELKVLNLAHLILMGWQSVLHWAELWVSEEPKTESYSLELHRNGLTSPLDTHGQAIHNQAGGC
mmetsp:Transcript_16396/g.45101  ORF Transcript_16396/g.45101 Transcript_16396/m.45101 type:complete len:127 (-) Transcript_16396:125-505(-)